MSEIKIMTLIKFLILYDLSSLTISLDQKFKKK